MKEEKAAQGLTRLGQALLKKIRIKVIHTFRSIAV